MVDNFALNLWVKGCFTCLILHLLQMIETNDISEEKIKMKQTMEGMKLYFFFLEHPVLVTRVPSPPLTFCSCRDGLVEGLSEAI